MLRRIYEADWERKKKYLIRSLFHDIPELSTIRESEELSVSPHPTTESAFYEESGQLPDLIVERVPKRRNEDESELFYYGLRKRMRQYYRMLFNIEKDGSSSPDLEDFVYHPTYSDKIDDDEDDSNRAFVQDFETNSIDLNWSDIPSETNETIYLEQIKSSNDRVNNSKDSVDESEGDITSDAKDITEADEINLSDETSKTAARNESFIENSKETIDTGSTNEISAVEKNVSSVIENLNEEPADVNNAEENVNQNQEPTHTSNTEYKERCTKSTNDNFITEKENEKDIIQSTEKENSDHQCVKEIYKKTYKVNANRLTETHNATLENDKVMSDEVEVMRSHNRSPSTQSLEATTNSSSSHNIYVERRGEIVLRHSLLSDRESLGRDFVATRPMDIRTTSPEDFHQFLRCSTPIRSDLDHIDENFHVNKSPILNLNSEQRYYMLTKPAREWVSEQNIRKTTVKKVNETEEIATVEVIQPVLNIAEEADVQKLHKDKEFKEVAVQTEDRMIERDKVVTDFGVQVQEREKEVTSVQVQTDADDEDVSFRRQRIFRSGSNYFIFL